MARDRVAVALELRSGNHSQYHSLKQNTTTAIRQTNEGDVEVVERKIDSDSLAAADKDAILAFIHVDRVECSVAFEALKLGWTVIPPQTETLDSQVARWHTIRVPSSSAGLNGNADRTLVMLRPDDRIHFGSIHFKLLVQEADVQVDSSIPADAASEVVTESKEIKETQDQPQASLEQPKISGSAPQLQVAHSMQESAAAQSTLSKATPAPPSQVIEETPTVRRKRFASQGSKGTASVRGGGDDEKVNGTMDDAETTASEDEEGGAEEAKSGTGSAIKEGLELVPRKTDHRVSPIDESDVGDFGLTGEDQDNMHVDEAEIEDSRPRRRSAEVRIPVANMTAYTSSKKRKYQEDGSSTSKKAKVNGASDEESQDSLISNIVVADSKKRKVTAKQTALFMSENETPKSKLPKVKTPKEKVPKEKFSKDKTPKDKTPNEKSPPNKAPSSKAKSRVSTLSKAESANGASTESYDGKKPLRVVFSGDSKVEEMKTTKKFLQKAGVEFVDKVSEDGCDMLCIGTGAPIKTAKLLLSVLLGKRIATTKWTTESAKANHVLNPDRYLPTNAPPDWHWGTDVGAALALDRRALFRDKTIFFTPAVKREYGDSFKAFKDIILKAGASAVVSKPAREVQDGYVVVAMEHGDLDAVSVAEAGGTCYQRDLLSMSILRGECDLESEEFRITPVGSQTQVKKGRKRKSG